MQNVTQTQDTMIDRLIAAGQTADDPMLTLARTAQNTFQVTYMGVADNGTQAESITREQLLSGVRAWSDRALAYADSQPDDYLASAHAVRDEQWAAVTFTAETAGVVFEEAENLEVARRSARGTFLATAQTISDGWSLITLARRPFPAEQTDEPETAAIADDGLAAELYESLLIAGWALRPDAEQDYEFTATAPTGTRVGYRAGTIDVLPDALPPEWVDVEITDKLWTQIVSYVRARDASKLDPVTAPSSVTLDEKARTLADLIVEAIAH